MTKHAILGTDLSKTSAKLVEAANEYKALGITKITLVHVLNLRDSQMMVDFNIDRVEKNIAEQKKKLEAQGFEVSADVIYGIPALELEKKRLEVGAGLIIVGSNGLSWSSSVLGSTASELLHSLKAPILLMVMKRVNLVDQTEPQKNFFQYERIIKELQNQEPDWEITCKGITNNILFTTDFSDFSENAFEWIANQKVPMPKVTLMHVQDEVKIGKHLQDKLEDFNRIDTERLNRLSQSFKANHPESEVGINIEYGKPTQLILNYIKQNAVTLTVMGSQGRGAISELFLGSVSHQIARHSDSHVLIVPLPR